MIPEYIIFPNIFLVTILAFLFVGFLFIKSPLIGSSPKAIAGGPSIIIFIHNNCIAVNGALSPVKVDNKTTITEAKLTVS